MSPLFWVRVRRRKPAGRDLLGCSCLASDAPPTPQRGFFSYTPAAFACETDAGVTDRGGCGVFMGDRVRTSPWLTPVTRDRAAKKWPGIRGGAPGWSDWWRTRFSRTSSLLSPSSPQWSTGRWWKNAGSSWTRYPCNTPEDCSLLFCFF